MKAKLSYDVNEILKNSKAVVRITVKGLRVMRWRLRVAGWILMIAKMVCPLNIEFIQPPSM